MRGCPTLFSTAFLTGWELIDWDTTEIPDAVLAGAVRLGDVVRAASHTLGRDRAEDLRREVLARLEASEDPRHQRLLRALAADQKARARRGVAEHAAQKAEARRQAANQASSRAFSRLYAAERALRD